MAQHRHKRETNARTQLVARLPRPRAGFLAAPLAVIATAGAVSIGVLGAELPASPVAAGPVVGDPTATTAGDVVGRRTTLSRGGDSGRGDAARGTDSASQTTAKNAARAPVALSPQELEIQALLKPAAVERAIARADSTLWTSESLNLWTEPGDDAAQTGEIAAGEKVVATGRTMLDRVEIVWEKDETRWVTSGYLTEEEPFTLGGECTNGTSVASGVSPNIVKVHQAVCAQFPDITVYGTFRGDGEHAQGIAVDIMVSGAEGQAVADFLREYHADLGISYLIYAQRIWSVQRSGEGWRGMENRGSTTANHYDHVHVTTY
ncbi:SH3 domain-containing protein [Nocardioides dongxiaopingii]|uniref:SH3 domain-containing protein n=1 Tax=Nocardioides sp. S-1144 TaxID=2582905 RepID=UPI00110E6D41|nr:SH3 domain-containing protein [Nocardioides sp. S-1144]QCW50389.1 SH3 domain-containing protein [Nocardioides sp. S-1144]